MKLSDLKLPKVKFLGVECSVEFGKYPNGATAIQLIHPDGGLMATATTNVLGHLPYPTHVFIKDYSENSGILKALEEAGIVKSNGEQVSSGYSSAAVAELLIKPREQQRPRGRGR